MRRWIKALPVAFAVVLLAGLCLLSGCANNDAQAQELNDDSVLMIDAEIDPEFDTRTIPDGIHIGDVDVSGMTASQAESAIRDYVDQIANQRVTLAANDKTLRATVTELGFKEDVSATIEDALQYGESGNVLRRYKEQKDLEQEDKVLPLVLTPDKDKVKAYLEENASELDSEAVNYGLAREGGELVVVEGQTGQEVEINASVDLIMDSFATGWQEDSTIELAVTVTEPIGSAEDLAQVKDVLGTFSTDYSSSSDARKTNIETGAGYINGSMVYPGETFSVHDVVTPFDAERGYEEAGSYENGTTVETYGGGICQVSTTLYNAVIRAELDIVERHGHSMMVSYVDPSADAAIAGEDKDLKFENNTDAPIYIEAYTDGETISFTIYGHETRPSNRTVSFESETTGTTEATVEYRASSASFGDIEQVQSSHEGATAQLWKIVTVNGVEESREIFNTTEYEMSPTIYEVGVSSSSSDAVSAMYDAISSQNIDRIYSTISAYSGYSSYDDSSYDDSSYDDSYSGSYDDYDYDTSESESETYTTDSSDGDSGGDDDYGESEESTDG